MPRAAKKLDFDDVTALVAVLGAIGAQTRKVPLTKTQVPRDPALLMSLIRNPCMAGHISILNPLIT